MCLCMGGEALLYLVVVEGLPEDERQHQRLQREEVQALQYVPNVGRRVIRVGWMT